MTDITTQLDASLFSTRGTLHKLSESSIITPGSYQGLTMHLSFPFPGEVSWPFAQGCDPYPPIEKSCELGNYVSYSINVTGADDVVAGIEFAKANNIRLVIKNTGHE